MQEWFKSVIEKEQATFIKGYKNKYEITMPDNCEYAGYKIEIGESLVNALDTAFCVLSYPEDYEFTLIKTSDREEGKRYQRPKLSAKEMSETLFNSHLYGLAYYNEYTYVRGVEWSRSGDYRMGVIHSGGKWFIDLDNYDVKRISAKNFELLAQSLSPQEAQEQRSNLIVVKNSSEETSRAEAIKEKLKKVSKSINYELMDVVKSLKRFNLDDEVMELNSTVEKCFNKLVTDIKEKIELQQQKYEKLLKPFEDLRHVTQLQKLQNGELQGKIFKDKKEDAKKPAKSTGKDKS